MVVCRALSPQPRPKGVATTIAAAAIVSVTTATLNNSAAKCGRARCGMAPRLPASRCGWNSGSMPHSNCVGPTLEEIDQCCDFGEGKSR